ncbi:MAG TPA: S24 family peptidase [Caldisericia bacterium]|nr:S24 family peptidase [Caldisericia bacterium]HQL65947.1 S24 family peptidase [Caldisericia bacterium]HQN48272.1 S24 family peptidase [Caldisericia bacterium]HQO99634.1 S24 family peptidase [Caldisericia bacterium]
MESSNKIKKFRESLGLTQSEFARRLGYSPTFVYQLENGYSNAGLRVLKKISETFNVPITELISKEDEFIITEDDESLLNKLIRTLNKEEKEKLLKSIYILKKIPLREIPILGYVSAGSPLELEDILYPIDTITMPDKEVKDVSFALIVKGDSMKNLGIEDGDILLVNPDIQVENGSLVIAIINNKVTFKKLKKEKDKVLLLPANDNYQPIELTPDMDIKLYKVIMSVKRKKF